MDKEKIKTPDKYRHTLTARVRICGRQLDRLTSICFKATCRMLLFSKHWVTSKHVKSSQNVKLAVKVEAIDKSDLKKRVHKRICQEQSLPLELLLITIITSMEQCIV